MTEAFISHLAFALGDETKTVEESFQQGKTTSDLATLQSRGFVQHHVCHPRTSSYQLAKAAVQQIQPYFTRIGAVIYSTCLPINSTLEGEQSFHESKDIRDLMNFPVNHLQVDFQLTDAGAFGLSQQASNGILGSLRLAKALLASEESMQQVLCVTSDRLPEGALYEQSNNLISDGSAACIVSRQPGNFRILNCYSHVTGTSNENGNGKFTEHYIEHGCKTIQETLQQSRISVSDISWIIPQNNYTHLWKPICELLKFDQKRVYFPSLGQMAHVMGGDSIINLLCLIQEHKIHSGDKILLFTSGYGINWQCVLLERV